ncbi:MAG: hypothetical protein IJ549_07760 [Prevotella sp.]|nr:hypothetical protein [Prevotella sp.]MBQ8706098.1 hypothetical protein [Paludibacteraceae bacterium]
MKRVLLMVVAMVCGGVPMMAQTANNLATTAVWALTEGTANQSATFSPANASDFVLRNYMTLGSELSADGVATTSDGLTQTYFKQGSKKSAMSENNAICFMIEPKPGIAFTPTKVSFKAARWVTDDCKMDAYWVNDDATTKTLVTGTKPNRDGSDATVSSYSYDLTGNKASEGACGLRIHFYGMNSGKQVSLGDVRIEGTLYGTVGEVITYTLTVKVSPEGAGTVKVSPEGTSFPTGEQITLTQTANDGYIFTGWLNEAGATVSTASPYKFALEGNTVLTAKYSLKEDFLKGNYTVIPSGDVNALKAAIEAANKNTTGARQYIFLENGTYDYGKYHNPESGFTPGVRDTIKVDNVSLIGESQEGVIIQIQPEQASVSRTSPIVIKGTGTYLQDLTLQNNFAYGGNEGQAAALQDEGHHTICKNVRLTSNQDTYYSHTDAGQLYFEDSQIEGTVDFICGNGDVFFNRCNLMCVNRKPTQGEYKGDTHIAAPYTKVEDFNQPGGHGYIFQDCYVDCKSQTWDFGRGWRGWPKMAYLNTILSADAEKRVGNDQTGGKAIDYSLRVTVKGIKNSNDSFAMLFYEYNTKNETGDVVSPASNKLTFTAYDSKTYETILKDDEIGRFALRSVYPDWQPDVDARQMVVTSVTLEGTTLSWTVSTDAKAFLIERDGNFVEIVDGTKRSFDIAGKGSGVYSVRAANMMGGFGMPTEQGGTAVDGIDKTQKNDVVRTEYYTTSGILTAAPAKGLNIEVKTYGDGSRSVKKVLLP